MSVSIKLVEVASSRSREYVALESLMLPNLKAYFDKRPEVSGSIVFYANNLFFCRATKDVDIIMVGELQGYSVDVPDYGNVRIERFCTVIEAKSHAMEGIHVDMQQIFVAYPGESNHNVMEQCKKEMDLLATILKRAGINAWVTSLSWLHGITRDELSSIAPIAHNAIASNSTFEEMMRQIAVQGDLRYNGFVNCSKYNVNFMEDMTQLFSGLKKGRSLNTIRSFNLLDPKKGEALYNETFTGEMPVVIAGRAGTGKTISLLQLATYLSSQYEKKCLILTYNTALVADIIRILRFAPRLYRNNIQVLSVQKYYRDTFIKYGTWEDLPEGYEQSYLSATNEFKAKIIAEPDIKGEYDYVFIDEAQDWSENERDILISLYGVNSIIAADGIDQFISSKTKIEWKKSLPMLRKTSLRQKANIVDFVNAYSEHFNLGWHVDPSLDFPGGTILIQNAYSSKDHLELLEYAKTAECTEYDFLFLVPHEMAPEGHFIKINEYKKRGINIYDGTNKAIRDAGYPEGELSMCRLYEYGSCRGLEGWITICLRFDRLIEGKLGNQYDQQKLDEVLLWSLMPLTRAVDRLIITLSDPESMVGQALHDLSERCNGVRWLCK